MREQSVCNIKLEGCLNNIGVAEGVRGDGLTVERHRLASVVAQPRVEAGKAPKVRLAATHEATLEVVPLETLKRHAIDLS